VSWNDVNWPNRLFNLAGRRACLGIVTVLKCLAVADAMMVAGALQNRLEKMQVNVEIIDVMQMELFEVVEIHR
jgi:hypothetical protein